MNDEIFGVLAILIVLSVFALAFWGDKIGDVYNRSIDKTTREKASRISGVLFIFLGIFGISIGLTQYVLVVPISPAGQPYTHAYNYTSILIGVFLLVMGLYRLGRK